MNPNGKLRGPVFKRRVYSLLKGKDFDRTLEVLCELPARRVVNPLFSLFCGAFFKSPETITVKKLTSNEISRFNLLQFIEQDDPDFARLAETIQADVSVSFRLLAYLNSVAFGFSQKIKSIQHKSLLNYIAGY